MTSSRLLSVSRAFGTIALALPLSTCGAAPREADTEPPAAASPSTPTEATRVSASAWRITPTGLDPIRVGTTLGELKQRLGSDYQFEDQANFRVDVGAVAVLLADQTQCYLLSTVSDPLGDDDLVDLIHIEAPRFHTAEGIGVGSRVGAAVEVYGSAVLSYNSDNKMREYVGFANRFANQPANLSFRTDGSPDRLAGLYDGADTAPYRETDSYRPDARIGSVLIR